MWLEPLYNQGLQQNRTFALSERPRNYAQEDFSTQSASPQQDPRLSIPYEDTGRPQGAVTAPGARAQTPHCQTRVPGLGAVASPPTPNGPQAWPKSARILNRAGFQLVYHSGRRWGCPFFAAFVLRNDVARSRVGLTTPRAIGKAVRRNRIRRRVREAVRRHFAELEAGWDVVLNPRGAAFDASVADLEAAVRKLFRELKQ